jgi:hypothetical protein
MHWILAIFTSILREIQFGIFPTDLISNQPTGGMQTPENSRFTGLGIPNT